MSCVLPFDIIALIIDIIGENQDTNLLKDLALVSYSFLQICSKHLFATVELHDAAPRRRVASSKKGFVKLLTSRPDVVKYIRKLTYKVGYQSLKFSPTYPSFDDDDHVLSPILPIFLRTISRLNCLIITGSMYLDWNLLDSSLSSAFLHLMHLPTINQIDLSFIQNFPLSSLLPSVNLLWLDIFNLRRFDRFEQDGSSEMVFQSEMPKIQGFHTSQSSLLTTKLLHAKREDGRPAFNFMDLRRVSMSFAHSEDERNIRYLLQNAKLLEKLYLSVGYGRSLVDILSLSAPTLKFLGLKVSLYQNSIPLAGICEELEAMTGHIMLEALYIEVRVDGDFIGSIIQKLEKVLVNLRWPALRQVSFKFSIACCRTSLETITEVSKAFQSQLDEYLGHLSKLESVAFNYSAYVDTELCAFGQFGHRNPVRV